MAKSAAATNDFDPTIVNALLGKIDGFHDDLASERGSYMAKCRNIRDAIGDVFDEAKTKGIPTKELKVLVKIRLNERKNQELYNDLEGDQQETLARLAATEKVADLPLWRSAKDRKPIPGVDVARSGETPNPMFEDDPQGLKNANFKPLN